MGSNVEGAELFDQLKSLSFSVAQATTVVNDITTKQASVMGLNDCFWLMGWICVGLSALLLLCFKHSTKPVYSSEIALE